MSLCFSLGIVFHLKRAGWAREGGVGNELWDRMGFGLLGGLHTYRKWVSWAGMARIRYFAGKRIGLGRARRGSVKGGKGGWQIWAVFLWGVLLEEMK